VLVAVELLGAQQQGEVLVAMELQIVVMIRMPMQVEKEPVVATIRRPMNSATDANIMH
jgi:hypothetical protein